MKESHDSITQPPILVGDSPAMAAVLATIEKLGPSSANILVTGESGTGKEGAARLLHLHSARRQKPFVSLNCGALQDTLLESELFGYEKGAFTGATQQKVGLVETADGGTLFLDEVGELAPTIQAKLLRFLQEGEFYRVGGKKLQTVDVRVISATNRDLLEGVKRGEFRQDLYYRLETVTLRLPALRDRRDDIPLLIDHFLGPGFRLGPGVLQALCEYAWPGNVRELINVVERVKILTDSGEIKVSDLPASIRSPSRSSHLSDTATQTLDAMERTHILRALEHFHGNKTRAAKSLGVTIKTLYNKLHRYGLVRVGETLVGKKGERDDEETRVHQR